VTLCVYAARYDSDDKETRAKVNFPIEFGMFAKEQDGKRPAEKSLFLAKYPVEDGDCTISVTVFRGRASALRPVRCGNIVTGT
jgi:hypothetical protein